MLLLSAVLAVVVLAVSAGSGKAQDGVAGIDPVLEQRLSDVDGATPVRAVLNYEGNPTEAQVENVRSTGASVHEFEALPMLGVEGTRGQIQELSGLGGVTSVYADQELEYLLDDSRPLVGADRVESDLGYTGEDIGVAVIDSGVDGLNPDVQFPERTVQNVKILGDNLFTQQSVTLEDQPNTDTSSGHGTHVAGTVGGDGTASDGRYTGVAPGADLVGIGAGDLLFILYALEGFDYALANQDEHNIQAISNSWGTSGEFDPDHPINVASKTAHDAGMTVVFAAGNSGPEEDTLNPYSVAPWVIGVAAGEKDGENVADFSSRGVPSDDLLQPTLTAPGVDIVSTRASTGATINALAAADDATGIPPDLLPFYTTASGTSMATPHVSGTVALMNEANPNITPDQAKEILEGTATPMPGYGEHEVGEGYLDALAAVSEAEAAR